MAQTEAPSSTPDTGDGVAPKAGLKARLPLIAMIAVGLAVGGGTGAAVIGPMVAKKMGRAAPTATAAQEGDTAAGHDAPAEGDKAAGKEGEGKAGAEGEKGGSGSPAVLLLDNLVLNPSGSAGSRFLLLSVAIEADGAKTVADLTARDAELRDIVLTSLGSKTVEQLTEISQRESIKTELIAAITGRFGKGTVKRLYLPTFVVQ